MTNKKDLTLFAKAISIPLYNTDGIKWPIRSGHIISQINDIYSEEYINQLHELKTNYDPLLWKKAIPSTLSIWRMAHHIINGLEKAGKTKQEIASHILMLITIIKNTSHDEALLSDSHKILPPHIISCYLTDCSRITSPSILESLITLSTIIWAYIEALLFQGREVCCEYHGPYTIDKNEQMLIRDFSNFNLKELWPNSNLDIPFKSLKIITFHPFSVEIKIEAYNNVHINGENFVKTCTGALFFIDGKKCDDAITISKILSFFSTKLEQQLTLVGSMSQEELCNKYIEIFWYRKKKLADFLDVDWKPSKDVFKRIDYTKIVPSPTNHYKTNQGINYIEQKFDYSMYI